jgi:hypothetical protein
MTDTRESIDVDSTEKFNLSLGKAADAIVCEMVWCDVRTDKPVTDTGH